MYKKNFRTSLFLLRVQKRNSYTNPRNSTFFASLTVKKRGKKMKRRTEKIQQYLFHKQTIIHFQISAQLKVK